MSSDHQEKLEAFHKQIEDYIKDVKDPNAIVVYVEELLDEIERSLFDKMLKICEEAKIEIPEPEEDELLDEESEEEIEEEIEKKCKCGEKIKTPGHEMCYTCWKIANKR